MITREDMENELRSRLEVATNSTKFPTARLTTLIQNAYLWLTEIFNWKDLSDDAKVTNTIANHDYYDQPSDYKPGSIYSIEIDGKEYKRVSFNSYLRYVRNNPTSTKRIFALRSKQFFVFPIPTTNGTDNMIVWGTKSATPLSSSTSETEFSTHRIELNECVIRKAFAVAILKTNASLANKEEQAAISNAAKINEEEWEEYAKDQNIQTSQWIIPDFFSGNNTVSPVGRFNYQPDDNL